MALENKLEAGDELYFVNPETREIKKDSIYRFITMCPLYPHEAIVEYNHYTSSGKTVQGTLERIDIGWLVRRGSNDG